MSEMKWCRFFLDIDIYRVFAGSLMLVFGALVGAFGYSVLNIFLFCFVVSPLFGSLVIGKNRSVRRVKK